MTTRKTLKKAIAAIVTLTFMTLIIAPTPSHAGYLIPPGYPEFDAGPCPQRPIHHKAAPHKIKHYRHAARCGTAPRCPLFKVVPAPDFVQFNSSPSYGHGRYVTNNNDRGDLDLSTGDDDPSVYPGMDIDN